MPKTEIETKLSPAQQELIEASIGHLIEFPTESSNLTQIIKNLKSCIIDKKSSPEIPEEITQLVEILSNPMRFIFRLEKLNINEISIADAQKFMLALINENLEDAAEQAHITLDWPIDKIEESVISPDAEKTNFVSNALTYNSPHPQELTNDPEKIYFANLTIDEINRRVTLTIRISIPDETPIEDTLTLNNFTESTDVIRRAGEIRSENFAFENAVQYLVRRNIPEVNPDLVKLAQEIPHLKPILTDKTYLSLIIKQKIYLHQLSVLKEHESQNLFDLSIKSLIKNDLISIDDAKKLTSPQKLVLFQPIYCSMFSSHKLWLHNLIGVKQNQCRVLIHPIITQLIKNEKLNFKQAKNLPVHVLELFSKNLYCEYFLKERINWIAIRKLKNDHCKLMINNKIVMLVQQNLITIDKLLVLSSQQLELMTNENIHLLLIGKHVSPSQLNWLPYKQTNRIKSDDDYRKLIEQGQVKLKKSYSLQSIIFFKENDPPKTEFHTRRYGYNF